MHPPPFRLDHPQLSNWPGCSLELHCCKGIVLYPIRVLLAQRGDRSFAAVLSSLRCRRCGQRPAPVYLCAGHRERLDGAPADWAIELVPAPRA